MAFQALLVEEFGSVDLAKDFGIILFIPACKHKELNQYKKIIQQADRFEIYYKSNGSTIDIPRQELDNFKEMLTQNIKPDSQRKFINNVTINVYQNNQRTAFMLIATSGVNSFVNFNSDSVHFGYGLTYRLGMTLDITNASHR